jgi:hypothetical protein
MCVFRRGSHHILSDNCLSCSFCVLVYTMTANSLVYLLIHKLRNKREHQHHHPFVMMKANRTLNTSSEQTIWNLILFYIHSQRERDRSAKCGDDDSESAELQIFNKNPRGEKKSLIIKECARELCDEQNAKAHNERRSMTHSSSIYMRTTMWSENHKIWKIKIIARESSFVCRNSIAASKAWLSQLLHLNAVGADDSLTPYGARLVCVPWLVSLTKQRYLNATARATQNPSRATAAAICCLPLSVELICIFHPFKFFLPFF